MYTNRAVKLQHDIWLFELHSIYIARAWNQLQDTVHVYEQMENVR